MSKIIAVDFDGTCVTHEYPEVGETVPHCVRVLERLQANDVKIILWAMRHGEYLQNAVDWFSENEITLWGINENPEQHTWSQSPKCFAHAYIDDAAIGCPLKNQNWTNRPFVDWQAVEKLLEENGFLLK